jgi:hypothetical protein
MNWDAIGAISELIGAAAVVATLAYLAVQIKQQNSANSASVHNNLLEGFTDAEILLAGSLELTTLFNTGLWEPDKLSDNEASQFSWIFRLFINQYIKAFRLYQEGVITRKEWENYAKTGAYLVDTPGGKLMVEGHIGTFSDFMQMILETPVDEKGMDILLGRRKPGSE